jgi:hypothetical protein
MGCEHLPDEGHQDRHGVRLTAGSFNAANLNKNLFVVGVTQTVVTVIVVNGSTAGGGRPIAAATVAIPGKVTFAAELRPHEHLLHRRGVVCRTSPWSERVPGLPHRAGGSSPCRAPAMRRCSSPCRAWTTSDGHDTPTSRLRRRRRPSDVCNASSGVLLVNGAAVANLTNLQFTITGPGPGRPCGRLERPPGPVRRQDHGDRPVHRLPDGLHGIQDNFVGEDQRASCRRAGQREPVLWRTSSPTRIPQAEPDGGEPGRWRDRPEAQSTTSPRNTTPRRCGHRRRSRPPSSSRTAWPERAGCGVYTALAVI